MTRTNVNKSFRAHLLNKLQTDYRFDNRKKEEYRDIKVELGVISKAEGSCRVTLGDTIVLAGTKLGIERPYPDRPDTGSITVNAELLPMSSPDFESGPPGIQSIELARVVDRSIREGGAIDFKKLSIEHGEKAWFVFIDIVSMNNDGNLMDAACLAATGALLNTKYPNVKDGIIDYKNHGKDLEIEAQPLLVTVNKIGDSLFVDALRAEEPYIEARLSIGILDDKGTICALQKGGTTPFTEEEIAKALDLAILKSKELRKALKGGKTGKK